jgi:DNA-binding NarL/FixJ family response regulator
VRTWTNPIRILLVDDHAAFREGVASALAAHRDFEIEHCASVAQAVRILQRAPAKVILLDHDLGTERSWHFFDAAEQIGFQGRVLIITAWMSEGEARRLLRKGAAGIFRKENSLTALANAIRTIARGEVWLDERYLALRGCTASDTEGSSDSYERLNEKERKVLRYILEGLSNKEIGWRLSFSESYVKAIVQRLFQYTGVHTRGQLVRAALERYGSQI